jgi:hypothetical protein
MGKFKLVELFLNFQVIFQEETDKIHFGFKCILHIGSRGPSLECSGGIPCVPKDTATQRLLAGSKGPASCMENPWEQNYFGIRFKNHKSPDLAALFPLVAKCPWLN